MYYRGATAAVIVYDITDRKSFEGAQNWIKEIREKGDKNTLIALAGNKFDLASKRDVPYEMADEYAKLENLIFMETSAKSNYNVNQLFDEIEKRLPARRVSESKTLTTRTSVSSLKPSPETSSPLKNKCCF